MNVLMVNDYADDRGGAESYVAALRELLKTNGHHTMLVAGSDAGWASIPARVFDPRQYQRTVDALAAFAPDVVHIHNCGRNVSPAPALAARRAGVPVVMTVHDAHLICPKTWMIDEAGKCCTRGFGLRCVTQNCHATRMGVSAFPYHLGKAAKVALQRQMLRRAVDTYICPSHWLENWIQAAFPAARTVHIPNFASRPSAAVQGARSRTGLLFCGRLVPEKGCDLAIEALALVPDVSLDIVGDGPERASLENRCRELRIEHRVTFHGRLAGDAVAALMSTAAALVVPSRWNENSPLVLYEALAAGTPVVGARRGGIPELLHEGETGVLFTPDDTADLVQAIKRLLGDPDLCARASREGVAWTKRAFSPEQHVAAVESVYAAARARVALDGRARRRPALANARESGVD